MDADFLLLHRMRNGDDQAIEDFVRKYYPMGNADPVCSPVQCDLLHLLPDAVCQARPV